MNGSIKFLRNVDKFIPDCVISHPVSYWLSYYERYVPVCLASCLCISRISRYLSSVLWSAEVGHEIWVLRHTTNLSGSFDFYPHPSNIGFI
jgi:hypothetical protein